MFSLLISFTVVVISSSELLSCDVLSSDELISSEDIFFFVLIRFLPVLSVLVLPSLDELLVDELLSSSDELSLSDELFFTLFVFLLVLLLLFASDSLSSELVFSVELSSLDELEVSLCPNSLSFDLTIFVFVERFTLDAELLDAVESLFSSEPLSSEEEDVEEDSSC